MFHQPYRKKIASQRLIWTSLLLIFSQVAYTVIIPTKYFPVCKNQNILYFQQLKKVIEILKPRQDRIQPNTKYDDRNNTETILSVRAYKF